MWSDLTWAVWLLVRYQKTKESTYLIIQIPFWGILTILEDVFTMYY